jgi:hypothetical protein
MALTHEEIHHFRHSGYLALPVRLPEQMQTNLKTAIGGDIAAEVEPVVRDGEGRAVRLSKILERAPGHRSWTRSNRCSAPTLN